MARLARLSPKESTRTKINVRARQLLMLLLTAIIGILLSVSVNAQSHRESKARMKQAKRYENACKVLAEKRTDRASRSGHRRKSDRLPPERSQNEMLTTTGSLPSPGSFEQNIIREMVSTHLQSEASSQPLDIAPLHFQIEGNEILISDINPFLIATEFGLQGKKIETQRPAFSSATDIASKMIEEVRTGMLKMGVAAERISIADTQYITSEDHLLGFRIF